MLMIAVVQLKFVSGALLMDELHLGGHSTKQSLQTVVCGLLQIAASDTLARFIEIQSQRCTYAKTGPHFVYQKWFYCNTCNLNESTHSGVCVACSTACHSGHDLQPGKESDFFCDCGSSVNKTLCKIMPTTSASLEESVAVNESPALSLLKNIQLHLIFRVSQYFLKQSTELDLAEREGLQQSRWRWLTILADYFEWLSPAVRRVLDSARALLPEMNTLDGTTHTCIQSQIYQH